MSYIKKNVLSISLFQGWMRALKLDSSGNEKSWSVSNKIYKPEDIREALKEAVHTTNSRGNYASIVLDHTLLRQKTIKLPPLKQKDLQTYLTRKVDQLKEFDEDAAFCYTRAFMKSGVFVSINYIPMSFAKELEQACLDAGLFLSQIIPFSMVRARQFHDLPIANDEVATLVIKVFEKTSLIIGNKEGAIFSERGLLAGTDDNENIERAIKEVKRSILYSKQQFGLKVALVKVSKHFDENLFQRFTENLDIPVEWLPVSQRFFWNKEHLCIPFNDAGNLISKNTRYEMNIRKNTKLAAAMVIAFWIVVISILVGVEHMIHKERKLFLQVKPQIIKQQNTKDELIKRREELDRLRHTVKVLEEERVPPVAGWFLGHLCNELPEGLILTKTQIRHKENKWEVLIEGVSTKESGETAEKLKMFSGNLQNGPFKMHVSRDWNADWLKQLREGNRGNYRAKKFTIAGVIR